MNIRIYGASPYRVVVVHAGPGYAGSAAGLARLLSNRYGVIEPLQTKDTIFDQVEELKEQIESVAKEPVILIGHSWGAILSAIVAATYPDLVRKLVLVSTLPLRESYLEELEIKREYHYSDHDLELYRKVRKNLRNPESKNKTKDFEELSRLCKISDEYQPYKNDTDDKDLVLVDGEIYFKIMKELNRLRKTGELLRYFTYIKCPLCVIHGQYDTHPVAGIIEPLLELNISHRLCIIDDSGHTPWREIKGSEDFFRAIAYEIESD